MILPETLPYNNPHVSRKVAVVTGGNSGIGWFTVLHLYLHGYTVYIMGRNLNKITRAIREIVEEASKRQDKSVRLNQLGELKPLKLDLLDLKSVKNLALNMRQLEQHIDILVLNAGIGAVPHAITNDGFEVQFQTNYVSHFLLTQLLLPLLDHSSRVIYVSSIAHYLEFFQFNREWTFNYKPNIIFTWFRYAMAKSAAMQYLKLLSMKNNLLCYSVHPGYVMNTNFFSYWTRIPFVGILFWVFFEVFGYLFGCTNEQGSYATLTCALSEELEPSGSYYTTGGVPSVPGRVVNNLDNVGYNWIWTVRQLRQRGYECD
ncbi:Env9p CYBJADRAFT_80300 [Cyberlindnera jadinii NRRL Y-1542]|uniref:NAD(P)-binding protein n=2 Tax=Cyberlindnera jadinii (strain ATCC 18201 / CBS 1600 / BCRC 20928 / JCM 3617 / NBRC 0987 / NRRL Y-1542) TaxID=983966 RepID=A0A1E4S304_CYBJN|nr:hypothetical protein CYBJADRAFT_80300 [Cyberlindnera jadinii NRRL Y-1542]ODV73917.1 hypothetical protein CYBJADRAFT_80300 [Cyberlindnera jadinii NRRL Y-1542]